MFVIYQIFNYRYSTNILYCELLFTNVANFIDNVDFFHKQSFDRLLLILIRFLLKKGITSTVQRKVLRYQRGNQKLSIEGQAIKWPKEKGQTMIYKTLHRKLKGRTTRNPLKTWGWTHVLWSGKQFLLHKSMTFCLTDDNTTDYSLGYGTRNPCH